MSYRALLIDVPSRCEACYWRAPIRTPTADFRSFLDCHHIRPRRACGRDVRDNLVLLCRNCHGIAEALYDVYPMPTSRDAFIRDFRSALQQGEGWRERAIQRIKDVEQFGCFWFNNGQFDKHGQPIRPATNRSAYVARSLLENA